MAIRLRERGDARLRRPRARRRRRRHVARQHAIPAARCDVPSHLYSFSFAPNPDWTQHVLARSRRSGTTCATAPSAFGVMAHVRLGHEVLRRGMGRRRAALADRDRRGRAHRATCSSRPSGALQRAVAAGTPGPRDLRRARCSTPPRWDHDHDLTGERVAVIGTGASAIQFVPQIQPRVGAAARLPAHAPWIMPRPDRPLHRPRAPRSTAASRPPSGSMRAGVYWRREAASSAFLHPRLMPTAQRAWPGATCAARSPIPELRAQADAGLHDRLQAHPDLQRLLPRAHPAQRRARDRRRSREVARRRGRHRGRHRARGGHDHPRHRLPRHRHRRRRSASAGATAARSPSAGRAARRPTWAPPSPGFPNLFMLVGPNTGLGHTSMRVHDRGADRLRARRAAAMDAAAQRRCRACARRSQAAYNAERAAADGEHGVDLGGCASWYLDDRGRNTTLWPGSTVGFRRALRRFEPADYAMQATG